MGVGIGPGIIEWSQLLGIGEVPVTRRHLSGLPPEAGRVRRQGWMMGSGCGPGMAQLSRGRSRFEFRGLVPSGHSEFLVSTSRFPCGGMIGWSETSTPALSKGPMVA